MEFLIYLFESILCFIEYPVNVFWKHFKKYKMKKQTGKIVLLFAGTLSGVLLIGGSISYLIAYLITYHAEWVVIAGLIFWFYGYVKSKSDRTEVETSSQNQPILIEEKSALDSQAEDDYAEMLEVLYQTASEVAPEIGALQPVIPNDMECDHPWIVQDGVAYYNFILVKEDPDLPFSLTERAQAKALLQKVCSKVVAESPVTTHTQKFTDKYGKKHEPITIHAVAQSTDYIRIQTVYPNDAYAEFVHLRNLKNQTRNHSNTIPDASWKS